MNKSTVAQWSRSSRALHVATLSVALTLGAWGLGSAALSDSPDSDSPPSSPSVEPLTQRDFEQLRNALSTHIPVGLEPRFSLVPMTQPGRFPLADNEKVGAGFVTVFGQGREWRLYVGTSEAAGDTADRCSSQLAVASFPLCVKAGSAEGTQTTQIFVTVFDPQANTYQLVRSDDEVTSEMLPRLRVERIVTLQLAGGGVIGARETVFGVKSKDYASAFTTSTDDLEALVRDRELLASLSS